MHKTLSLLAAAAVLVAAHTARADFGATLNLSGNLADPLNVYPNTPVQVTVLCAQQYAATNPGDDVTFIQLNWTNSSAGLNLTTASTWTWHPDAISGFAYIIDRDDSMADGLVARTAFNQMPGSQQIVGIQAPAYTIGTLAVAAPAYNPGGGNTHTFALTGGSYAAETLTALADGDTFLLNGAGLTLGTYAFTVVSGGVWTAGAGNQWHTAGNWSSNTVPDASFQAVFNSAAPQQPTLTKGEAVRHVDLRTAGWTVGGSAHTLSVGDGGIDSAGSGTNTVSPAVALSASGTWTVGSDNTLTVAGGLSLAGRTLIKDGPGTLNLAGPQTHTAGSVLTVAGGTVNFQSDAGAGGSNLTVNVNGSEANFASAQHLAALNLNTGTSQVESHGSRALVTKALWIDATDSSLDIKDNILVIDYPGGGPSPLMQVVGWLQSGLNWGTGFWDGYGIRSSVAAADTNFLTSIGVVDNSDGWVGGRTDLEGEPVDATSVLIKYTYFGDANLDGAVTFDDYDVIDYFYWFPPAPANSGWWNGDFNYDGFVTLDDYDFIDYAYWFQGAPLVGGGAAGGLTPTPEPATLGLAAAGLAALAARRRARR